MSCSCFSTATTANVAEPNPTKHVNYNLGMVLGVDDFTQEFAFLSGRDQWMARDLIGYGTVRGLKIVRDVDATKGPRIAVEPGVAVSPRGQMICVPAAQCAFLKDWVEQHSKDLPLISPLSDSIKLYVVLCYRECPTDNVPIAGEPCRSEDQLVAASRLADDFCLELRTSLPRQREDFAVRDFVEWLRQIDVTNTVLNSTPLDQFLDAIRAAAAPWFASPPASPPSSPPGDFMFGVPPGSIHVRPADVSEYMRAAFRIWVTELRPKWIARWHGCAATHFDTDDKTEEDCVLLAELTVPIVAVSPGSWTVAASPQVQVDELRRPFVIHLRMLQEWLLRGGTFSGAGGFATLNITSVNSSLTLESEHQFVIVDTTSGVVNVTLPAAAENHGRVIIVKRVAGANACRVARGGADLIDGANQVPLNAINNFVHVVANRNGNAWHVIGIG
jgi:hypothetical protein